MNLTLHRSAIALLLSAAPLAALAHGDEPHGDAPHPAAVSAPAGPRVETATEAFELVGRLEDGALTLFINRFETNEPVLQASVDVESGEHKAVATFRADQGSYVIQDATFIEALGRPGAHPLVVTLTAGEEADLLEATLTLAAPATGAPPPAASAIAIPATSLAGSVGLAMLGAGLWAVRRRRRNEGEKA